MAQPPSCRTADHGAPDAFFGYFLERVAPAPFEPEVPRRLPRRLPRRDSVDHHRLPRHRDDRPRTRPRRPAPGTHSGCRRRGCQQDWLTPTRPRALAALGTDLTHQTVTCGRFMAEAAPELIADVAGDLDEVVVPPRGTGRSSRCGRSGPCWSPLRRCCCSSRKDRHRQQSTAGRPARRAQGRTGRHRHRQAAVLHRVIESGVRDLEQKGTQLQLKTGNRCMSDLGTVQFLQSFDVGRRPEAALGATFTTTGTSTSSPRRAGPSERSGFRTGLYSDADWAGGASISNARTSTVVEHGLHRLDLDPEPQPRRTRPPEPRAFRSARRRGEHEIAITADDLYTLWVNGEQGLG